jgi:hypothetical protein
VLSCWVPILASTLHEALWSDIMSRSNGWESTP